MLKKICTMLLVMVLCISFIPVSAEAKSKSTPIKTAKALEKYLKKDFGKLKTKLITFDLKDNIRVIKNEGEYSCFDFAIVIDWYAIEDDYYRIQDSTKYTDAQKAAFEKSIKSYQKKMAAAVIKLMPKKKIRGGFLDYGYEYPNIKEDYYEGAVFGWKNYDYTDGGYFPGYDDTEITNFNWHSFNDIDDPVDTIGLY